LSGRILFLKGQLGMMKKAELAKLKGLHFILLMIAFLSGGFLFTGFIMPIPMKNAAIAGTSVSLAFIASLATLYSLRGNWPKG
jgi:hypothetical protein